MAAILTFLKQRHCNKLTFPLSLPNWLPVHEIFTEDAAPHLHAESVSPTPETPLLPVTNIPLLVTKSGFKQQREHPVDHLVELTER